ncbi:unnamed protein product [Brugia timori]|uniref:Transcriptional regulator n=1 Tax=Brugia timori TaxID=42155 RepID=A0A0R3QDP0_9BILA|nr:unnamed protein product [Brugia timori]
MSAYVRRATHYHNHYLSTDEKDLDYVKIRSQPKYVTLCREKEKLPRYHFAFNKILA